MSPATAPRRGELWAYCAETAVVVVHRFRRRAASGLLFQGDAAGCLDRPVAADRLVGRVTKVERRGRVRRVGLIARCGGPLRRRSRELTWMVEQLGNKLSGGPRD